LAFLLSAGLYRLHFLQGHARTGFGLGRVLSVPKETSPTTPPPLASSSLSEAKAAWGLARIHAPVGICVELLRDSPLFV
jgi:hypothetical protein